ncbi:hypothetical protein F511_23905 [Dorcoceras hygrometricum]|uniref:Uncharacterized protein n=1 Tax=Dorcoceras hygrometricum TaxID=472368 RepID=A0A2Z7A612_9LAMI|nr:hypothetical protein F511_23905 [Dorcoceras hygrometricum]
MACSPFINTLQVDFASVLAMEHTCMVRMFKSLEDTGLRGFLEGTTYVFENAVTEIFANAKVVAGTIISTVCNRKLAVIEDIFSATFKLSNEGLTVLADIQKATIIKMQHKFSATEMPFKISGKKREMHFEYRLLHDIVAKSLCEKAGSFDSVTCEKFEFMTAIFAGISVKWGRILFQILLGMLQNSKKQSRGYTVLTSRSVQAYIKQNQDIIPEGEPSTREDTSSNPETSLPHQEKPAETKSLAVVKEKAKNNPKKKDGGKKKWTKKVIEMATQTAEQQTVEERRNVAPTNFDYEEVSELDSCPLVTRRRRREQTSVSSDSESTISMPLKDFMKKRLTQRPHPQTGWTAATFASQLDPNPVSPTEPEGTADDQMVQGSCGNHFEKDLEFDARKEHEEQQDQEFIADERAIQNEPIPVEEYCQLLFTSAWNNVFARMTMFEEWLNFRREGAEQTTSPQLDHLGNETQEMNSHEHQSQENEPAIQTDGHRTEENEHQALDELVQGSNQTLEDSPVVFVPSDQHDSDHQGPAPTNLQLIASASVDTSTLQLLDTAAQSLTALSTRVSSFDQEYSCIRDDTNITRHHTILMRDQLKNVVDRLYIKIDVLERTLTQRMAYELAVVKSQLSIPVEGLREFGAAKKG